MGLPAYNIEPEHEELFRQMIHEEAVCLILVTLK
jgi:hypothetical protein